MAGIWDYVKGLFEQSAQSTASEPATHELISRSPSQEILNENFKNGLLHRQLNSWIKDQYLLSQYSKGPNDSTIQFISADGINGFVIYFKDTKYKDEEVIALFDNLKEKILPLGYYCYLSDSRSYIKQNKKEEVQRHYLKPATRGKTTGLIPQHFGNITIELIWKNNVLEYLKLNANTYNDHLYAAANPFEELINIITD